MPLYLVKWNDGTFALVHAEDDLSLVDTLDQLGDPGAASWTPYDGPVWLEFSSFAERLGATELVDPIELGLGRAQVAETDDGLAFQDELLELLQPHLWALREQALLEQRAISREELDAAIGKDADYALPGSVFGEAVGPES